MKHWLISHSYYLLSFSFVVVGIKQWNIPNVWMICTLTSQCKMVQLYLISYVRVLAIRPLNLPNIILFCASSPSNKEIQFIIDCILIKLGGSTCRNSAGGNLCGHRYLQRLLAHRVNNRKSKYSKEHHRNHQRWQRYGAAGRGGVVYR